MNYSGNSFFINLPNGPYEWVVTFDTEILQMPSLDPEGVFDRYNNSTVLTNQTNTNNEDLKKVATANASIHYYEGVTNDLTGKTGEQNPETENVDYELTINPEGLTIHNAKITDTLSDNHQYVEDSIKVIDEKGVELTEGFTLSVADDNRSFEVTFEGGTVNTPYKISYETRLNSNLIGTYDVTNNVVLTGGTKDTILDSTKTTTSSQQWTYGGGGSGRTLEFTLNKRTANGNPIANATFDFTRVTVTGTEVPIGGTDVKTNADGTFKLENVRAGRYIVKESSVPEGYQQHNEPIYMTIGYASPTEQEATGSEYIIKITDEDWKPIESDVASGVGDQLTIINDHHPVSVKIEAQKNLDGNKELEEGQFTFDLLQGGKVIDTATNRGDGRIVFDALTFDEVGTYNYQIKEHEGDLSGVKYDTTPKDIVVTVTADENGVLSAETSYGEEPPVITNNYQAAPTGITLTGKKHLTGQDLHDDQFEFGLFAADNLETPIQTATNKGNDFKFDIAFEEARDYDYVVRELDNNLASYKDVK